MVKAKKLKAKVVAYLSLEMLYLAGESDSVLPKEILRYHDRLETALSKLEELESVGKASSSGSLMLKDGEEWWRESTSFSLVAEDAIEPLAERLIKLVQRIGIRFQHRFELKKQLLLADDAREVSIRRIQAARAGKWTKVDSKPQLQLKTAARQATEFPEHLQYLAAMAGRCFRVGGKEVYQLLKEPGESAAMMASLKASDRAELMEIYSTIVRKKHHEWLCAWMRADDGKVPWPKWVHEFAWLLGLLDRLRDGGLMAKTRGIAKRTVLYYWDDYLSGEPRTCDD